MLGAPVPSAWLLLCFPPLTLVLLDGRGRYRPRLRDAALDSIASGFGAISIGVLTLFAFEVLLAGSHPPLTGLIARLWLIAVIGVTAGGLVLTAIQHAARSRGHAAAPTVIVGADATGLAIAGRLRAHPEYGLHVIGFLDAPTTQLPPGGPPLLGSVDELDAIIDARHVIVCFPEAADGELLALIAACDERGIETTVVPRLLSAINHETRFEYLGTTPLLNLYATDLAGRRFTIKHALDRATASALLIIFAPLMAAIALAVALSSRGPVLFRQQRVGHDGRLFTLLKFRTMVDADRGEPAFRPGNGLAPGGIEGVDRRTAVGRVLRNTAMDELPQLINIVRGEMSLVGPRPERPEFAELFHTNIERYDDRHRVRSGMTGWAQVNGYRGQTSLAERIDYDNFYIEHWSLALDLKILVLTIPAMLKAMWSGEGLPRVTPPDAAG